MLLRKRQNKKRGGKNPRPIQRFTNYNSGRQKIPFVKDNKSYESFTHRKSNVRLHKEDSNLLLGSQGDTEVSPSSDLLIDGASPPFGPKARPVRRSRWKTLLGGEFGWGGTFVKR